MKTILVIQCWHYCGSQDHHNWGDCALFAVCFVPIPFQAGVN